MSAATAGATLARAAGFWAGQGDRLGADWHERDAAIRARYTANCFRELDGFLRLLLDELAPEPAPKRRNTANKLGLMTLDRAPTGIIAADCDRLRAIGRSAACLFHLNGWVRRPDVAAGGWMTAGWPDRDGATLRRYPLGDRLRPGAVDVADVCDFYQRVGEAVRG